MKKIAAYLIVLLTPLLLLTACGGGRPSLEDRIGESGQQYSTSYEGVIKPLESLNVYQQGTHQLIAEDQEIIILQSPTISLNRYVNEEVLVKGMMQEGIGDSEPVFSVNEISYTDKSRSAELKTYEDRRHGFRFTHPSAWIPEEESKEVSLYMEENKLMSLTVISDETDLDSFANDREGDDGTEVTIGAQKALRFTPGSDLIFYVQNPPKKKIYIIKYMPQINAVGDEKTAEVQRELFYDLIDSFELIYLNQAQGEKCGGLQQIECPGEQICQLEGDGKYAEGICAPVGGEQTQTNCPFIAPPASCNDYRIAEYSQSGCPARYECLAEGEFAPASFRDLNVVDAGEVPEGYQEGEEGPPEAGGVTEEVKTQNDTFSEDDEEDDGDEEIKTHHDASQKNGEGDAEALDKTPDQVRSDNTKEYDVPDVSDITAEYVNKRASFSLLMPKTWYYASFGVVDGAWKVGFADVALEELEKAIIILSLEEASGGQASKKIDDTHYNFHGPDDLKAVMEDMAESVEKFE